MRWQDIIQLDDAALQEKGVAALGARRKMLKVFESVRNHCQLDVSIILLIYNTHPHDFFFFLTEH